MLTIATWNLKHAVKRGTTARADTWRYLADVVAPTIALTQEASAPPQDVAERSAIVSVPNGNQTWSTRVASFGPALTELRGPLHPSWNKALSFSIPESARTGTLAVASVELIDGPVVLISLYGRLGYADQSVIRVVADLLPLFDTPLRKRVILGGDLNIHSHSNNEAERRRAKPILDLIEALGLTNLVREAMARNLLVEGLRVGAQPCPCDQTDCYHVRTHRHGRHRQGEMANNDYLFGSPWLAARMTRLTVYNGDDDRAWTHSDHAPLVADFDVPA